MSPCLEDCPPEVIETVVSLLDFGDICRLRLTWRSLAAKSSHLCFKAFFRSKRVLFSEASLGALRDVTQPGRLGCLLEDLVLVGLANGQGMASSEADESADEAPYDLLRHAFRNLKANSKGRELLSLSLQANLAFFSTDIPCRSEALTATRLPVRALIVYNNGEQQCCSLACDELGHLPFRDPGLSIVLSSLTSLSISVSERVFEPCAPSFFDRFKEDVRIAQARATARAHATAESTFIGLARCVQLAPSLIDFEIHYFQAQEALYLAREGTDALHTLLFEQLARSRPLPTLARCRLRAVHVRDAALIAFLEHTAARHVCLEHVTIVVGQWKVVFDSCTRVGAPVDELHVDDVYEGYEQLHFHDSREPEPTAIRRTGAELRQPLRYAYQRMYDTPRTRKLRILAMGQCGPPLD